MGVITDEHLSWNPHVYSVVAKANRMLCLIKRTIRGLDDSWTLKTLYCTLIRFNLDCGSVVWSLCTKRNIEKLERVQRREIRLILKTDDPYEIRLKTLNLMSQEKRRLLADVSFLFRALNGYINIDVHSCIDFYSEVD